MSNTNNAIRNVTELVNAAVAALKAGGLTEAEIIPHLPHLATEAVKYLAGKR
jgi:predicted dinucleotide-binding enzyme